MYVNGFLLKIKQQVYGMFNKHYLLFIVETSHGRTEQLAVHKQSHDVKELEKIRLDNRNSLSAIQPMIDKVLCK